MRVFSIGTFVAAVVLLAGCPGEPGASGGGATGARPPADVPKPEVGEVYIFKLLGGAVRQDEIVAVGTATITVSRSVGMKDNLKTETVEEPLEGPGKAASIQPTMAVKSKTEETVKISGKSFPCVVREAQAGTTTIKEWSTQGWPHVIRTVSGPFVTLELSEIHPRKMVPPEGKK